MPLHRPCLFVALVWISLVACDDASEGQATLEKPHHHYVANKMSVPTNTNQAREYGLDLNNDGTVDNRFGTVLSALSNTGIDIQGIADKSVAEGSIILLVDLQTGNFQDAATASIQVYRGDTSSPPACNTGESYTCTAAIPPVCSGCQHHLQGGASFTINPSSPTNDALAGKIVDGTFTGGPGSLSLQIALGGTRPIELDLIGARAKATSMTNTAIGNSSSGGVIFAGAVKQDQINNKVIPAIQQLLVQIVARDCTMPNMPPGCGCASGSTGSTILSLFDTTKADGTAGHDCVVSVDEIKNNNLMRALLAPDVTIDGTMALSFGIKTTAVAGVFTPAGQ
jgi:hypothetical protein